MKSAPLFLAILIYATTFWSPSQSVRDAYIYKSQRRQQGKLKYLCRELVLDAEMKIKSVQHYRDQYYKSLQYQLGDIVYELRHFFKRMVKLYQYSERNVSYNYLDHNENVRHLVEVRRMGEEIENKVIMVHEWQYRRATPEEHHAAMKETMRSGPGRDYDESQEQLRESVARERIARARGLRPRGRTARFWGGRPPPSTPRRRVSPTSGDGAKKKNKKWQYVARGY